MHDGTASDSPEMGSTWQPLGLQLSQGIMCPLSSGCSCHGGGEMTAWSSSPGPPLPAAAGVALRTARVWAGFCLCRPPGLEPGFGAGQSQPPLRRHLQYTML